MQKKIKKGRKKYTRKSLLPSQRIQALDESNKSLETKIDAQQQVLNITEKQRRRLGEMVDNQHAEIAQLRERNLTLIEAIETLARASRMEKQNRQFSSAKNYYNTADECNTQAEATERKM